MPIYGTQRNATNNQSTVDYVFQNIFTYGNRYHSGIFINNLGETINAQDGFLVVRNAGTFETATIKFAATALTAGQTIIIAGLTYTSTAGTTQAQLAAAFANLADGATTGAGILTGTYSGALTGYSTSDIVYADTVVFTASTVGNKTDLVQTGTGAAVTSITIEQGTSGTVGGFSPATETNLANVIGILKVTNGITSMADSTSMSANYCTEGDIDASMLILPAGITLDSMIGSKALRDVLTSQGFVLNNVIEGAKFDN